MDLAFHERTLLDGLTVAGAPFRPLYEECLTRSETVVPQWKRLRRAQRAHQLARYVETTARVAGARAECGVFRGMSALLIASTLRGLDPAYTGHQLYLIDSFEGLGAMHPADAIGRAAGAAPGEPGATGEPGERRFAMPPGTFDATSADHVRALLGSFPDCTVVRGWIPGVLRDLPPVRWAFVHLDVDLYEPTREALEYFLPRIVEGGVLVNDDYASPLFPGAGEAWDEVFDRRGLPFVALDSGQAVFVNARDTRAAIPGFPSALR